MSTNYFASRLPLIEGPDELDSGAWPITWLRIAKGWGVLPAAFWPDQNVAHDATMPNEPPNADDIAKRFRLSHYQRLRNELECLYAVTNDRPTSAALEISKAWTRKNAPKGRIPLDSDYPPSSVHSIALKAVDFDNEEFVFPNSWGRRWGDDGLGYLPFGYLTRFMVEAWTSPVFSPQVCPIRPGIDIQLREGEHSKLGVTWIIEILDGDKDVMVGWAFAVQKQRAFDIEELFIRPDYRRRGLGAQIGKRILDLNDKMPLPIRFWIPWGDHTERNALNLLRWAQKLRLRLEPSGVRWAAYRAELGSPVDSLPALSWNPHKATSPLHVLERDEVVTDAPAPSRWNDDLANRRSELVEKKYRISLTQAEQSELDTLQEEFGRYQDTVAPFPPQ
jgi:GNAT superfamily N-acetyltransferase